MQPLKFKLILAGDGRVGKTSWIAALRGSPNPEQYRPTLGCEVNPLQFFTVEPVPTRIVINAWDTAGQERFAGLQDGYYISGQLCVIAYDTREISTYNLVPQLLGAVEHVCDRVPMCVVGMKAEGGEDCRLLPAAQHTTALLEARGIPVLTLDAKSGRGLLEPIECLLRQACGDGALTVSLKEGPAHWQAVPVDEAVGGAGGGLRRSERAARQSPREGEEGMGDAS